MPPNDADWNRWFIPQTFLKNYQVLARIDPRLAGRLRDTPLDRPDVVPRLLPSGLPSAEYLHQKRARALYRGPDPYAEADETLDALVPAVCGLDAGRGAHGPSGQGPSIPPEQRPPLPREHEPSIPPEQRPSIPPEQGPPLPPEQRPSIPPEQGPPLPPEQGPSIPPKQGPSTPPAVLLAGLGLGYHLERLLERLPADIPVWVFEPDPLWIYLTLSRIDLSGPIRQGRLHIAEGLALLELVAAVPAGAVIVAHPGLEPRLRWEVSTLRRSLAARDRDAEGREAEGLSGGSDGVDGGREPPPVTGQRASDRSELTPLRVCLVEGELFFEDLAEAFRQRGDALAVLHPARLSPEEILEELARARPDLVLSVNQVEGLAELCAQARVPYVVWEIDPRMWVVQPPAPVARPWVHTFTYRRKHVARYLEAGFPFVEHLPLAATPAFRMPVALDDDLRRRYGAPVSFVGSSLVLDNLRDQQRAEEALRAKLQACTTPGERERWTRALQVLRDALRAQQSDLMRPVLIEMLEAGWAALGLVPELEVEGRRIDLRIVYARMFGTRRRALVVSSLARHGVAVYGDQAWREVLGPGCEYRGPADHGLELTRIYNASILNLDIGRLYQLDIVTMRVFDILACGAFPLVERSEELDELLAPGLEVVSWSDLAGLDEAAAYYLHHPGERLRLVEAGRARVLRDHTVARRVETMIERLRARGVLPRAAGNSGLA